MAGHRAVFDLGGRSLIISSGVTCAPGLLRERGPWCATCAPVRRQATSSRLSYADRQLNNALHTVVASRIQYQQATRDYVARLTAEGNTSREIKRCLARYVARDLYRLLESEATAA